MLENNFMKKFVLRQLFKSHSLYSGLMAQKLTLQKMLTVKRCMRFTVPGFFNSLFWEPVMKKFVLAVKKFAQDEEGVTAIEYGLIAALMAVAITAGVALISNGLTAVFTGICTTLGGTC